MMIPLLFLQFVILEAHFHTEAESSVDGNLEATRQIRNASHRSMTGTPAWKLSSEIRALNQKERKAWKLPVSIGKPVFENADLIPLLSQFSNVYAEFLVEFGGDLNNGGTGFMHAFYLWTLSSRLNVTTIIESGAHMGLGTWFIRQACQSCRLFVISPENPSKYRDKNGFYFVGKDFKDFDSINWKGFGFDMSRTLVFFDDHQAGSKRLAQAKAKGFLHLAFDDNYSPIGGDNYSLKKALSGLDNVFQDNFGKIEKRMSTSEVADLQREVRESLDTYFEFPPVWPVSKDERIINMTRSALFDNIPQFVPQEVVKRTSRTGDSGYRWFCYAKLHY